MSIVDSEIQELSQPIPSKASGCEMNEVTEETTRQLASMWSRILKIDKTEINNNDNFFDLGGDSIGAMKLVSELRQCKHRVTVAQIFANRQLTAMAKLLEQTDNNNNEEIYTTPPDDSKQSTLSVSELEDIRPMLANTSWDIEKVYPTRPLQEIAVKATISLPRYSIRYDKIYFKSDVDRVQLLQSCAELVQRNEILRTVFVHNDKDCLGVVVRNLPCSITEYEMEGELEPFCHTLCDLDIQTTIPYGSSFTKFFFVKSVTTGRSCLIFRISHAQYDEMCLPVILRQLSQLYQAGVVEPSLPFSTFVKHITEDNIPKSTAYWKDLLNGSRMLKLAGPSGSPVSDRTRLASITRKVDIRNRPNGVTLASFPTAAWALCLSRRLSSRDLVFGEVVGGRNTGFDNADQVVGPCWQYIPFRAQLDHDWTGRQLLEAVQEQHITSSQFEGMALSEIVQNCTDWGSAVDWFDSVLHQAVAMTESLSFTDDGESRVETHYPHLEPLREWKIQAFAAKDEVELEVVTFEEWRDFGNSLLSDLCDAFEQLVQRPEEKI